MIQYTKILDKHKELVKINECLTIIKGHVEMVNDLSILPQQDHFLLATASSDTTVQV